MFSYLQAYLWWVGGFRKWYFLVTFSNEGYCVHADRLTEWLGRSENVQKYADVIYGWSL